MYLEKINSPTDVKKLNIEEMAALAAEMREALEGLNTAGEFKGQFLILVNDNQMSIAENHGGLYASLKALRESNGTSENNLFRAMGLDYRYEAAGNDIGALIRVLNAVKDLDHLVVLHINTLKGKGYEPAETRKEEFPL